MIISTTVTVERNGREIRPIIVGEVHRGPNRMIHATFTEATHVMRQDELPWIARALEDSFIVEETK